MSGPDRMWEEDSPERLYVVTGGRSAPADRAALDLVTLMVSRTDPRPEMQPEHAAILRLCRFPLSVAELTAYLSMPVSVVTVLLADLLADQQVMARPPVQAAVLPD